MFSGEVSCLNENSTNAIKKSTHTNNVPHCSILKIAPLYSMDSAERSVHPLIGSASKIKYDYYHFKSNLLWWLESALSFQSGEEQEGNRHDAAQKQIEWDGRKWTGFLFLYFTIKSVVSNILFQKIHFERNELFCSIRNAVEKNEYFNSCYS